MSKYLTSILNDVQNLILENLYLQEEYPDNKLELELSLKSLRELESEITEALERRDDVK